MYFGFQEQQDIRRALRLCAREWLVIDQKNAPLFFGTVRVSFRRRTKMAQWQRTLFRFLQHNASSAIDYFKIPVERILELGIRLAL